MIREQFFELVKSKAEDDIKNSKFLEKAFNHYCRYNEINSLSNSSLKSAIIEIIENALNYKNISRSKDEERIIRYCFDNELSVDEQLKYINPVVISIRKRLFDIEGPPFPNNIPAAIKWLQNKSEEPVKDEIQKKLNNTSEFFEEYIKKNTNGEFAGGHSVSMFRLTIPYITDTGIKDEVSFRCNFDLGKLKNDISLMSGATGFFEEELTNYILTGIKPRFPRYKTDFKGSLHFLKGCEPRLKKTYKIEINVPDLSFNEIKAIYDEYRKLFKSKGRKPLTDKQKKLYLFIQNHGCPPQRNIEPFWESAKNCWNEKYPDQPYERWQAIYKAYRNIISKVNY